MTKGQAQKKQKKTKTIMQSPVLVFSDNFQVSEQDPQKHTLL